NDKCSYFAKMNHFEFAGVSCFYRRRWTCHARHAVSEKTREKGQRQSLPKVKRERRKGERRTQTRATGEIFGKGEKW
ncbi:MAG: hypothetical protein L0312_19445, partial [Acidobacteria bacterium]|nr:hypothetical protein [Acidobacteriota bacterium]